MASFLLGWCEISLFGTLLAVRLIRNGRRRPVRNAVSAEIVNKAHPDNEIILPPDAPGIRPRAGH